MLAGSLLTAQDNLWVNGSQLLDFNAPNSAVTVCGLPLGHDYNGAPAQYAQNAQYDEHGKLLFFVVDGNIYDHEGYRMADNDADPNCHDCLMKGMQQVSIRLMPGACDRYMVITGDIATFVGPGGGDSQLGYSILDLSLDSHYHGGVEGRKGRIWHESDLPNVIDPQWISTFTHQADASYITDRPLSYDRANFVIAKGRTSTAGEVVARGGNIYHAVYDNAFDQGGFLFARNAFQFLYAPITAHGIPTMQNLPMPPGQLLDQPADNALWMTGQMAVSEGWGRILLASPRNFWKSSLADAPDVKTLEVLQLIPNGTSITAASYTKLNTNPGLAANNEGRVHGLSFGESGQYLFFTQPFAPYIGYVDMADLTVHDVADELNITSSLAPYGNGQIACNFSPVPGYGVFAMYFPSPSGIGFLARAESPSIGSWFPTIAGIASPPTSYLANLNTVGNGCTQYLMDMQNYNDQQIPSLELAQCCQANERIPEANHTNTFAGNTTQATPWTPQNNPLASAPLCAPPGGQAGHVFFAQDFTVQTGAKLYVRDMEWRFGPNARLIVQKGAFAQFDNCILRGDACAPGKWPGVELYGTPTAIQGHSAYPADQGRLVLNNSTVQDAVVGVTVGKKDIFGIVVGTGGILEATGSSFRNCRIGVNFYPYQNKLSNGSPTGNRSTFVRTTFTADAAFISPLDFSLHAQLWKVDGIRFMGCTFNNLRTTEHNSSQLGRGIHSLDAGFSVTSLCGDPGPVPPGLCQNVIPTRFAGLDMGIRAANAVTARNFTVDGAEFNDNVCGVFANGISGYVVINSKYKIGGSVATAMDNLPDEANWYDRHRGLYSYKSTGFSVDDNTLQQHGSQVKTEGIVIGYSGGNNDLVFRNYAQNLERAFIGEGICAEVNIPGQAAIKGLQFLCNQNSNNTTDIWSRKVTSDFVNDQNLHTIRLDQGGPGRPADNQFDQWPTSSSNFDFKVTTTNSPIGYWHRGTPPFVPIHYTTNATGLFPHLSTTIPQNNCASKILPMGPPVPPDPGPMATYLATERTAYNNVNYLYGQLIDGGNTDAISLQIEVSWPQDAWNLRNYLLARSPNLSTDVLKDMVRKNIMPEAMVTEVLAANPGATRTDGFLTWLQEESRHPLPQYLLNLVMASWDQRTYRDALSGQLALHQTEMTQAANWLVQHYRADTTTTQLDSLAAVWHRLGTVDARYAEAITWMEADNWAKATAAIDTLSAEPDKKGFDVAEQQRMRGLIAFLGNLHAQGGSEDDLDSTGVAALEGLMEDAHDRPANWISNLLCFGYGRCRAPLTGGDDRPQPRLLPQAGADTPTSAVLSIHPNPASSWVAFNYNLQTQPDHAELIVRDAAGREVYRAALQASEQQHLWDTREVASGTYTAVLLNGGRELRAEKLIVKQ